jgi:transposase
MNCTCLPTLSICVNAPWPPMMLDKRPLRLLRSDFRSLEPGFTISSSDVVRREPLHRVLMEAAIQPPFLVKPSPYWINSSLRTRMLHLKRSAIIFPVESSAALLRFITHCIDWGIGSKKTLHAAEQDRPDVKAARDVWKAEQPRLPISRLVFLDESGARTNMTRLRGRVKGGARCVDTTPHGGWSATTMISAVRLDGSTAAMVIEGATDAPVFREYVRHVLAPTLRPGDIVILDNLAPHNDPQAHALIQEKGAIVRFLPPYSPDLNPIEHMWSKVKQYLRKVKARTAETLLTAIRDGLQMVTPDDARGWFRNCGYVLTQS